MPPLGARLEPIRYPRGGTEFVSEAYFLVFTKTQYTSTTDRVELYDVNTQFIEQFDEDLIVFRKDILPEWVMIHLQLSVGPFKVP